MRLILAATAAAAMLVGCDRDAPDNRSAPSAKTATPVTANRLEASFDCAAATGQAQELICGDAGLAMMDRTAGRLGAGDAGQADWARSRGDCWKADELRQCVMASTVLRIHALREKSPGADEYSNGPTTWRCAGMARPVIATFVTGEPGAVALRWGAEAIAIEQVESASGVRFEGRWNGQPIEFWTKGSEATFTLPGKSDVACVEAPPAR